MKDGHLFSVNEMNATVIFFFPCYDKGYDLPFALNFVFGMYHYALNGYNYHEHNLDANYALFNNNNVQKFQSVVYHFNDVILLHLVCVGGSGSGVEICGFLRAKHAYISHINVV